MLHAYTTTEFYLLMSVQKVAPQVKSLMWDIVVSKNYKFHLDYK